jgi:UDP-N-acetylglucosamine--N-acetylmuramyl-(pentapeptide) pyrophosphoryl-undecaprenol N-acetylglucosamine transferase
MAGPIVIAAGGTGGHLFPAEATARALMQRGRKVALFTDTRGGAYADRFAGAEVVQVRSGTPSGRSPLGRIVVLGEIAAGVIGARGHLKRLRPAAVAGFGGYPSLPTMLAAVRFGVPTLIHEQNAVLGRVNRLVAGRVSRIALSLQPTRGVSESMLVDLVGNPVRPAILTARDRPYPVPSGEARLRLLVTGGSQGARVFGELVPAAVALLDADLRARLDIVQQCRAEDLDAAKAAYAAIGLAPRLVPFIDDMPAQLASAHLCLMRSGASTVAELAVAGRPAILVPYPHATDDHQTANAEALSRLGAAELAQQSTLTPRRLADFLTRLFGDPDRLARMAAAARGAGRPDAAERLADLIELMAGRNGDAGDFRRAA